MTESTPPEPLQYVPENPEYECEYIIELAQSLFPDEDEEEDEEVMPELSKASVESVRESIPKIVAFGGCFDPSKRRQPFPRNRNDLIFPSGMTDSKFCDTTTKTIAALLGYGLVLGLQGPPEGHFASELVGMFPAKREGPSGMQNGNVSNRAKATNIAQKAALEAKAASDAQLIAGQQAAHQVKIQLAEKAQQAAQAAQAALSGKQQIVDQLEEEVRQAEAVVQEEGTSLQQAQAEVQAAGASSQQAQQQLKVLTSAVQLEQNNVGNAEQAAQGAQQELAEKLQLVEAAKHRVSVLLSQLSSARADLANTKQAAQRASAAAQEAKANAARNRRDEARRLKRDRNVPAL